jgi:hypothetical protein
LLQPFELEHDPPGLAHDAGERGRRGLGARTEVAIALDWTDFEKDDHTTLCAYLVTRHGRATPLAWKPEPRARIVLVEKDEASRDTLAIALRLAASYPGASSLCAESPSFLPSLETD